MVINIPQYHNQLYSLEIFQKKCHDAPEWEISVPQEDDILWSIVLSYLMSANFRDSEDFGRRLKTLTGKDEDTKSVKKAILSFNPFRDRFACFFNQTLKQVVSDFKTNLKWDSLITVSDKISAVAELLKCPICLISSLEDNVKASFFSVNTTENEPSDIITLISSELNEEESRKTYIAYNFMLRRQLGFKLKRAALLYYLREAGLSRKRIYQVMSLSENEENFLISVLKSDFRMVLKDIYKSPYIVSKLSDAGYDTDPKSRDGENLSAICHALIRQEYNIVYTLYYFAVNSCFESNISYRSPDCHVVRNLQEIEKILLSDLSKSNVFKDYTDRDEVKKSFDQLLGLNKFLTKVTSKILRIRDKLNYYETVSDNVFEVTKRRDIIVSILNAYEQFFKPDNLDNTESSPLEDYIKHKHYYYSIDVTTATCFFDNIIYLKERLALENNIFSNMEASFLFLVLIQVLFRNIPLKIIAKELPYNLRPNIESVYAFPMMQRQLIISKTKEFSKTLQDKIINHNLDILQFIPKDEIHSALHNFPEVKDHLQIVRLKSYLNTALKVKVIDIKSVLVIERSLQVLGEYMKQETDKDFSIIRRIFPLCFPKDISHILRQIRHELTHLKGHAFPSKFDSEKNYALFQSIQKEIRSIKVCLQPVFQIQKFREAVYALNQFEEALKRIKNSMHSYRYNFSYPFYICDEMFIFCKYFPKIYSKLFSSSFLFVFKTVLISLDDDIPKQIINISNDKINIIKNKLWPLKFLLELSLIFPKFISDCTSVLLKMFNIIEECNLSNEFDKYISDFLKQCKEFISVFVIPKQRLNMESINYIETFLRILKGFTYFTNYDKEKIRKEIPFSIRESVAKKNRLISSIDKNDFSLNIEEQRTELEISYLSRKNREWLEDCYANKSIKALDILKTLDPIAELENVFNTNCVSKQTCKSLCCKMQFSDKTKRKLFNLVPGEKQKPLVNNLVILLNRIKLLRKIIIEDNKYISEFWTRIKNEKSQQFFLEKMVKLLLRDKELQTSVEMLLFDCMIVFENERSKKNTWIKSCKLYSGINLRNIISHGNPLLECLCSLLDPDDLLTEMTCKMLRLIECEDMVAAILEVYQCVNNDFAKLASVLYNDETDEFEDLKNRVLKSQKTWEYFRWTHIENDKRKDWEFFMMLIPDNP